MDISLHASAASTAGAVPPTPQPPADLGDALLEAAEQLLGPVAQWQWRRQVRLLAGQAALQPWFAAAARHLRIDCVPVRGAAIPASASASTPASASASACVTQATLAPGPYLWIHNGQVRAVSHGGHDWRVGALRQGPPPEGGALYRVVPSHTFAKLGWREFRQAALSDSRLLREIGLATFVINAFALVIPLYMNAIYDRVLPAQADMSLWVLSLGAAFCLGLEYLLRNERSRALMRLADEFQSTCLPQLTHWLSRAPLTQALDWGHGAVRGLAALSRLRSLYWSLIGSSVLDLGFAVLYLAIIAWLGGLLALAPAAVLAVGAWVMWRYDRQLDAAGPPDDAAFSVTADRYALYRAANAESVLASEYLVATETLRQREQRRYALQSRCSAALNLLGNGQTLLIVVVAYYLVATHRMQPAGIFAAILLSGRMLQPLGSLMTALPSLRQMHACLRQVNDTLGASAAAPPMVQDMARAGTGWCLRDVSLRYGDAAPLALKDVSLDIRPGERIAIVGPAAGGKSTLLKLLLGVMAPTRGSVQYNGCALAGDAARALREQVHYGWQSAELIGPTPRDYLDLDGTRTPDELAASLRQMGLAPVVARWPQGLATPCAALPALGRRTLELLALARLALSRRAVYALDTPSECLDPQAERQLLAMLRGRCGQGATLLLVTDKANLLTLVDRVLYVTEGQIRFDGTVPQFQGLLAQGAAQPAQS